MTEFKYDTNGNVIYADSSQHLYPVGNIHYVAKCTINGRNDCHTLFPFEKFVQIEDDKKHKAELREEIYETNKLVSGFMDDVGVKESKMVECIFELKKLVAEQQKNITRLTSLLLKQKEHIEKQSSQIEEQRLQIFNINHPPLATSLSDVPNKLQNI